MSEILNVNNHSLRTSIQKLYTVSKYGENPHVQLNFIQCYLIKAIDNVNNKKAHGDGIIKVSFSIFITHKRINTNVYRVFFTVNINSWCSVHIILWIVLKANQYKA